MNVGGITLDPGDVQAAVYSLDPVPVAWMVAEGEGKLIIRLDVNEDDRSLSSLWTEKLSELLGVRVTVERAKDMPMLDRTKLLDHSPSTKPVYFRKG